MAVGNDENASWVKSATRTLDILECVAAAEAGLSHADIARALDIPKSSLTRLLRSLAARRYLALEPDAGRFTIGPQVLPLSRAYLARLDPVRLVGPVARSLRDALGEAVTLAVLDDADMVVLVQEPSGKPLAPIAKVGDRSPALLSASGKAIAAFLGEAEIDRLVGALARLKDAPARLAPRVLSKQLQDIRAGGIAISREEAIPGVAALALPVFGPDETRPLAALAVALPAFRLDDAARSRIERQLRPAAAEATTRLGGSPKRASVSKR
jgi:DNA-binding IclR family transcriptional regulator